MVLVVACNGFERMSGVKGAGSLGAWRAPRGRASPQQKRRQVSVRSEKKSGFFEWWRSSDEDTSRFGKKARDDMYKEQLEILAARRDKSKVSSHPGRTQSRPPPHKPTFPRAERLEWLLRVARSFGRPPVATKQATGRQTG